MPSSFTFAIAMAAIAAGGTLRVTGARVPGSPVFWFAWLPMVAGLVRASLSPQWMPLLARGDGFAAEAAHRAMVTWSAVLWGTIGSAIALMTVAACAAIDLLAVDPASLPKPGFPVRSGWIVGAWTAVIASAALRAALPGLSLRFDIPVGLILAFGALALPVVARSLAGASPSLETGDRRRLFSAALLGVAALIGAEGDARYCCDCLGESAAPIQNRRGIRTPPGRGNSCGTSPTWLPPRPGARG